MVTSATKEITLTGTTGLSASTSILAYNTNTFLDSTIVSELTGISEDYASDTLSQDPTASNIEEIYTILSGAYYYSSDLGRNVYPFAEAVDSDDGEVKDTFAFYNYHTSLNSTSAYSTIIDGAGFNVIIFVESGGVLGYVIMSEVQGESQEVSDGTLTDLYRSYEVHTIYITVDSTQEAEPSLDQYKIYLINNLDQAEKSGPGDEFITYSDRNTELIFKNYTNFIGDILEGENVTDVLTDNLFCKKDPGEEWEVSKLGLLKNVQIPSSFTNYQFGYYKGDFVVFLYNPSGCQYSIYSLTETWDSLFDSTDRQLKCYSVARKDYLGDVVSETDTYTIPTYSSGVKGQTIRYFSGRYIVVDITFLDGTSTPALFDIERQSGYTTEDNSGWIVDSDGELRTNFIVDALDPNEEVYFGDDEYGDYPEYLNGYTSKASYLTLYKKIGDWLVYKKSSSSLIYTNTRTSLDFSTTSDVFVINDNSLLQKNSSGYYLYDTSGTTSATITSRYSFSSTFFQKFRRSYLPETIDGLSIIGALRGIIYYKIGNYIDYL